MKRTQQPQVNIPDLVEAMITNGASFYFTDAGTLFVRDLSSLPAYLVDEFMICDGKARCQRARRCSWSGKGNWTTKRRRRRKAVSRLDLRLVVSTARP